MQTIKRPKHKFFISFSIAMLILFVGVLYIVYSTQTNVFWKSTINQIVINTEDYEKSISLWFAPNIKMIDIISSHIAFYEMTDDQELNDYFTYITNIHPNVMATYLAREDKSLVFSHDQKAPEGFDPTVRGWYIHAQENFGTVVVSDPYIDILTGKLIVTITQALQLSDGLTGAVGIDFDLSEIIEFVNSIHSYQNGTSFLLLSNGNIITHEDARYLPKDVDGDVVFVNFSDLPISDVLEVDSGSSHVSVERLTRDGVPEFAAFITVSNMGWIYGTKIPLSDFDENLLAIAFPLLLTLSFGFILFACAITLSMLHVKSLIAVADEIDKLALMDPLTSIPNRRYFDAIIYEEWKRAARGNNLLSLCMIDIDRFKNLNDTFGHKYGDKVLYMVAEIIKSSLRRTGDFAARWGGEEFTALLPNTDETGARRIAEDIRINIENAVMPDISGQSAIKITVSIGVVTIIPDGSISVDEFIQCADTALYTAKESGRNQVAFYR